MRYAADRYTVPPSAVGRRLRARISGYTDGHGSGKTAQSSLTTTVRANEPGSPGNFTAEPGNVYTRVDLSWSAAVANGSAITRYEYRYKAPSGSWSGWTSVGVAYSTTVSGLSSGQRYSFEVRAVNGEGAGPSSSTSSLVRHPAGQARQPASAARHGAVGGGGTQPVQSDHGLSTCRCRCAVWCG